MDEDLSLACAAFREAEVKEAGLIVVQDKALQRVMAVWPLVPRRLVSTPMMVAQGDWEGLWACVEVDVAALSAMCGLPGGYGPQAFARAKAIRLIYPDGSLHAYGKLAIQKVFKDAVQG